MDTPARSPSAFVGRMRELAMLHDTFTDAIAGRGKCILLSGEAGIGKTTLAEVFCREAVAQGASLLVGRCYDLTATPPYGPWAELFGRHLAKGSTPAPPPAFTRHGAVGKVESPQVLHREVADFLAALAKTCPVVLLLDDMHWADPASLDLLRFVARELSDSRVLCLVAYRGDELGRSHPLATLLPLLVREAGAMRIDLGRFSLDTLRALVRARFTLDASDENRLVTYLAARAEGHTLFTVELLRTLEEHGILREGERSVGSLDSIGVPTLLRRVIDARLEQLGEDSIHLLRIAAIIGQEAPLSVWSAVAQADPDLLLEVTARAADARLADETSEGDGIRFAHALIREVLYEGMRPSERRRWHRQAGEVLSAYAHPDPDEVASHFQRANDPRAATWLVMAGTRARLAFAFITARERYEGALAVMDSHPTVAGERGWVLYLLANTYFFSDPLRAVAIVSEVVEGATAYDATLMALASFQRGLIETYTSGRGLSEMLAAVRALEQSSSVETARIRSVLGPHYSIDDDRAGLVRELVDAGRFTEAVPIANRLVEDGKGSYAMGTGAYALGVLSAMRGQPIEAQRWFVWGHAQLAMVPINLVYLIKQEAILLRLSYAADRPDAIRALLAEAIELDTRVTDAGHPGYASLIEASLFVQRDDWEAVKERALRLMGFPFFRRLASLELAPLAYARGDIEVTRLYLEEMFPDGPQTEPGTMHLHGGLKMQRIATSMALNGSDLPTASAWLQANDHWLAWSGAQLGRSEGAALWAQYYRQAGNQDQAYAHAERALALASDPRQPLALLAAHRLLGELHTDARRFDAARTHLTESLRLAEACAAPYECALTLLACAALNVAATRSNDARRNRCSCLPRWPVCPRGRGAPPPRHRENEPGDRRHPLPLSRHRQHSCHPYLNQD